ncbi:uncharacterized protein TNCV_3952001 [Trichonephila clavipes]|nr:uncharacterized protein TNCV_3952001 [Trichonephila clavipes]
MYKDILTRNLRCSTSRRVDEADISIPVAVYEGDANYLEEILRSITTIRSRYRSSHADVCFRNQLRLFQIVWFLSVHCFHTRITLELFHCTRTHITR